MSVVIKTKSGTGVPPSLVEGELAVDTTNAVLYVGSASNSVISLNASLLPLDNTWTGLNTFTGGLRSEGAGGNSFRAGTSAGQTLQGLFSIAIGQTSGYDEQGNAAIAIGLNAGRIEQGADSIAIGTSTGVNRQGTRSIAIGNKAGYTDQGNYGIILSAFDGFLNDTTEGHIHITSKLASLDYTSAAGWSMTGGNVGISGTLQASGLQSEGVGQYSFRAGLGAGQTNQGENAVAIGVGAGDFTQGDYAVAIGPSAGGGLGSGATQGDYSVAIGYVAGRVSGQSAIAIGNFAGNDNQGEYSIAIGHRAAVADQGDGAIAIGKFAGQQIGGQNNNSICIISTSGGAQTTTSTGDIIIQSGGNTWLRYKTGAWVSSSPITSSSDETLKENIELIPDALSKVNSLRGVTFNWINDESGDSQVRQTGVIAQDVQKVLPEVVQEIEDGILVVQYGPLVGLLVEAIKEQQSTIEALEARLTALENV